MLGKSGLEVSVLGLGCMGLSHRGFESHRPLSNRRNKDSLNWPAGLGRPVSHRDLFDELRSRCVQG